MRIRYEIIFRKNREKNLLAVQWLELQALATESPGSIIGQRTKVPQVAHHSQKKISIKKKR